MNGSILRISDAASLGLHAMMMLTKNPGKLLSVKDIAAQLDISANHLSKVMQRLTKAGYIESIKGFNGGFKLIANPEEINFLEIYELFDGKIKVESCLLTHQKCNGNCIFGDLIFSINRQVKEKFESTKLSDLTK